MGDGERDRADRGRALVAQCELWLMDTPNDKRRPVLATVVVAPVTSSIRDIPTVSLSDPLAIHVWVRHIPNVECDAPKRCRVGTAR